jgi:hypothetical protein
LGLGKQGIRKRVALDSVTVGSSSVKEQYKGSFPRYTLLPLEIETTFKTRF